MQQRFVTNLGFMGSSWRDEKHNVSTQPTIFSLKKSKFEAKSFPFEVFHYVM